ncbi:MAG: PKD domain-containing protein, partial [Flavobacteriia bacterium]|nr:PKD domain-containing protein [Flavobacteriia bacterium]
DTNYIVSLSVTNLCGTANFLDTILVHPLPIASFATTVNNGCSPLPVGFQNLSIGSPTNYIWNFGDGSFSTAVSPTHTFTYGPNDTIFNVALIAINACGSDTAYYPIHVFPNTVSSFFNTNPTVGCAPLNVQFTNFSQGGNLNYFWSFGNGQVSNQQSPSHNWSWITVVLTIRQPFQLRCYPNLKLLLQWLTIPCAWDRISNLPIYLPSFLMPHGYLAMVRVPMFIVRPMFTQVQVISPLP